MAYAKSSGAAVFAFFSVVAVVTSLNTTHPSPLRLRSAIKTGYDWFLRNQTAAGDFLYEYDLALGKETVSYNIVRQTGATYGLAQIYRRFPDPALLNSIERSLSYFVDRSPTETHHGLISRYVGNPAGLTKNNATAVLGLALLELRQSDDGIGLKYESVLHEYARHILRSQKADGRFFYRYDAERGQFREENDYNTGESFYFLAKLARFLPQAEYEEAAAQATAAVRDYYQETADEEAYLWLMLGYRERFLKNNEDWISKVVIAQTDQVLQWPLFDELRLYLDSGQQPASWMKLGAMAEGIGPAASIAQRTGRHDRYEAYLKALKDIGRYLLASQINYAWQYDWGYDQKTFPVVKGAICPKPCGKFRLDVQDHNLTALLYLWDLLKK